MKKDDILDCIEYVSPELILEADNYKPIEKTHKWTKWIAVAACLCVVVIAGIFSTRIADDKSSRGSADWLRVKGMDVYTLEKPQYVTYKEMPVYTHDEIIALLNEHPAVVGRVTKREDLKIKDDDVIWCFSIITIDVSDVINGKIEQDSLRIVSGTTCNTPIEANEFLISPQVEDISEGKTGLFVLREFDENPSWTIGEITLDAHELGDYLISMYLEKNNDAFWLQGNMINLEE